MRWPWSKAKEYEDQIHGHASATMTDELGLRFKRIFEATDRITDTAGFLKQAVVGIYENTKVLVEKYQKLDERIEKLEKRDGK